MQLNGRKLLYTLPLALAALVLVSAAVPTRALTATTAMGRTLSHGHTAAAELRRIHAHFDSVLVELAERDVSQLTPSQRTQRATIVTTVRQYNARGVFPHNYDFPVQQTPYFVDRKTGTLCAVAFLLESTGRRDIVDRVARSNNNVWVAQLKSDSAFGTWLENNGLTLAEAARIQVPYQSTEAQVAQGVVGVGSIVAMSAAIGTTTWNAWGNSNGHNRAGNALGMTSGIITASVGATLVGFSGSSNKQASAIGVAGIALGGASVALAARSMHRRPKYLAAKKEAEEVKRRAVDANFAPIIPLGKNSGAGLSMSIRF